MTRFRRDDVQRPRLQYLAQRFDAAAALDGGRSAVLRRLIATATTAAPPSGAARLGPRRAARIMVRLAAADVAALDVEAAGRGLSRAGWLAALVRLRAHLDYISRNGDLPLEDRDGTILSRCREVAELAEDWSAMALLDSRRRISTPFSLSIVLSMPETTDPAAVRDAARAFALEVFAGNFDYAFALHADTPRPHVHLAVRALGDDGRRLIPKKADLESWRRAFAQALRDRDVEAEATPRRGRGITRKSERTPLRKLRERAEAGRGAPSQTSRAAYRAAARAAFQGETKPTA